MIRRKNSIRKASDPDSAVVDLLMADAAYKTAVHQLIKNHHKEFDRMYDIARASFDPSVKSIRKRLKKGGL